MKKSARMAPDRMISGKLRNKAARHGAEHTRVTVDGVEYAWAYRHGWLVWGKGIKAISLSVSLQPGRTRELVLDLSLKVDDQDAPPPERRVLAALDRGIRSALEAGWAPESRGRAFRFEISEAV